MWFFLSFYRYSFLRYIKSLVLYGFCKITTLYSVNVIAIENVKLLDGDDYKPLSQNCNAVPLAACQESLFRNMQNLLLYFEVLVV